MAATGDNGDRVVFAGGSANPYNFNGIAYDGVPATAESFVFSYSFLTGEWRLAKGNDGTTVACRFLMAGTTSLAECRIRKRWLPMFTVSGLLSNQRNSLESRFRSA